MRNSVPINLEEMDKFLERCNLSGLNQEEREDMNHQFQVPNGIRDLKTANCAGGPAARTRLPVQVRSPVRELDPTCIGEGGGSLMPQKDPAQPDYTCIYAQKTESPGPEGNGHPLLGAPPNCTSRGHSPRHLGLATSLWGSFPSSLS